LISVAFAKTLIFFKKQQQVGSETLPSGYLPLPVFIEPALQVVKTHGNDGNLIRRNMPYTS